MFGEALPPFYRKVGLNGRPLCDAEPNRQKRTDAEAEKTCVDALTLQLRHQADSTDVSRRVLEIEPGNVFANLYLAYDTALAGAYARAEKYLERIDEKDLKNDTKLYWMLTRELIAAADAQHHSIGNLRQAQRRLRAHYSTFKKPAWQFVRAYNLALAHIADLNFAKSDAFFYRLRAGKLGRALCGIWQYKPGSKSRSLL